MRLIAPLLLILLALTSLSASALEKSCAEEDNTWLPARYYDAGAIVFYDGQWYAAQEWQEGQRPDGGSFAWKPLDKAPECDPPRKNTVKAANNANGKSSGKVADGASTGRAGALSEKACKPAPTWTFSDSYRVGQWVTHEGQVYKAIRPTTGDMPGVAQPPHWAPVNANCPEP